MNVVELLHDLSIGQDRLCFQYERNTVLCCVCVGEREREESNLIKILDTHKHFSYHNMEQSSYHSVLNTYQVSEISQDIHWNVIG